MSDLQIKKSITLTYSADRWELYSDMPGAEKAALEINQAIQEAVNSGMSRSEVYSVASKVMDKFSAYGACDSEPQYHMEKLLDKVFGEGKSWV